jgi:biopolymer transport protein ExbD
MRAQRVENGSLEVTLSSGETLMLNKYDIQQRELFAVAAELAAFVKETPDRVRIEVDGLGNITNASYGLFGEED